VVLENGLSLEKGRLVGTVPRWEPTLNRLRQEIPNLSRGWMYPADHEAIAAQPSPPAAELELGLPRDDSTRESVRDTPVRESSRSRLEIASRVSRASRISKDHH